MHTLATSPNLSFIDPTVTTFKVTLRAITVSYRHPKQMDGLKSGLYYVCSEN